MQRADVFAIQVHGHIVFKRNSSIATSNRAEGHGRLAEAMWDSDCSDAIHWRVLDRGIEDHSELHPLMESKHRLFSSHIHFIR